MTIQIAVRLADDTVHGLDAAVAAGLARSRADLVDRALRRELRRQRAVAELPLLPRVADDTDDLEALGWVGSSHGCLRPPVGVPELL